MGATESKQKLGERVIIAQKKLSEDVKAQNDRATQLMAKSPQTMQFLLERMAASFKSHAAFLEATLLIAYKADPVKCRGFILDACSKVLSAPIQKEEYEWFKGYVLPSSVWMLKTRQDRFMYQDLLDVVNEQSAHIVSSMDSVYAHLKTHSKWNELMAIENQNIVDRQDDPQVALLKDAGIQNFAIAEMKNDVDNEDAEDAMEQMKSFVDSHVAITSLTVTAKRVDKEFQNYVQSVMGHLGHFKPGPLKKVERCLSKLENDYHSEVYPKSAKLLDLVRCSVTFNTLEQLLVGYEALMQHMQKDNQTSLKLARVKNGFLDDEYDGGYRDIKVNTIFNSSMHADTRMVVEVQLILNQYLTEKLGPFFFFLFVCIFCVFAFFCISHFCIQVVHVLFVLCIVNGIRCYCMLFLSIGDVESDMVSRAMAFKIVRAEFFRVGICAWISFGVKQHFNIRFRHCNIHALRFFAFKSFNFFAFLFFAVYAFPHRKLLFTDFYF